MAKFLLTYSERWAVTYEIEAADADDAWDEGLTYAKELKREIVHNEIVTVEERT